MITKITRCRALVMPGMGPQSGRWFACYRFPSRSGHGVASVGGPFVHWEAAARLAVSGAALAQRQIDATLQAEAEDERREAL